MRRLATALLTITMTTTGCATYESARSARNSGIVIGVVGLAATAAGIALTRHNDERCRRGGGCDGESGAATGAIVLTLTGITLLPCALVGLAGASDMEKLSPDAVRRERERTEPQRIERELFGQDEREAAERRERERIERDKARWRDRAR